MAKTKHIQRYSQRKRNIKYAGITSNPQMGPQNILNTTKNVRSCTPRRLLNNQL